MIRLNKLNGVEFLVNSDQIEYIDAIPESKIVLMNGEYLLAKNSMDEIIEKVIEYKKRCFTMEADAIRKCLSSPENRNPEGN